MSYICQKPYASSTLVYVCVTLRHHKSLEFCPRTRHTYFSHGTKAHAVMEIQIGAQTHHMFSSSQTNARHNKISWTPVSCQKENKVLSKKNIFPFGCHPVNGARLWGSLVRELVLTTINCEYVQPVCLFCCITSSSYFCVALKDIIMNRGNGVSDSYSNQINLSVGVVLVMAWTQPTELKTNILFFF